MGDRDPQRHDQIRERDPLKLSSGEGALPPSYGLFVAQRSSMSRVHSFPPIVSQKSKVLILGSMPGEASLKAGQYYAHSRNAFWPIMGEVFGAGPALPYLERVALLQSAGVALWDSLQACVRPGSLDASITEEVANDFPTFFGTHLNISHVFFNGGKAETTFRRHVLPTLSDDRHTFHRLPSTSPAHAAMAREAKVKAWSVVRKVLDDRERQKGARRTSC
jgi:hypoxanthine-DNA glycosylase